MLGRRGRPAVIAVSAAAVVSVVVTAVGFASSPTASHTREFSTLRRADHYRALAKVDVDRYRMLIHSGLATTPDPTALQAIRDVALEFSALNGDQTPTSGQVYSSTREVAERVISGDGVNTDQPVYTAVIQGTFVGYLASVPPGSALPTGNTLTITFDSANLDVTDWGISNNPPTAGLGASVALTF